jgi:hypothetical protein
MANTPTPQEMQELIDLLKQVDRLNDQNARSFAEVSKNAGNVTKEIRRLKSDLNSINSSFSSIAQSLKDSIQEFSKYNTTASNTKKSFTSLQSISSRLLNDQAGYSRLTEKELIKLEEKITLEAKNLSQNLASRQLTTEQSIEASDVLNKTAELITLTKERIKKEKEIQNSIGLTGNALKGLSKIPGIGGALDTEQALEDMREFAEGLQEKGENINSFNNKLKIAGKGFSTAFGGLKKSLTDPVAILSFIGEALFKGSEGIANFRKELGLTYGQAYELNTQLNFVGNNVFDASINGEKLKKSFIDLSQSMGFVADYGNDALVTMTNLTGKLGLSNQEASQLTTLSRLQSTNTEAVLDNVGKTVSRMNQQGKTSILLKDVMKEVANTSKATAVSLGSNPAKITEAVVAAKQLGTTLQQIESTADSLLNFESSIESELKAELLTGKQMNLERARAAALANDMKTLSEEIGKNEEVIGAFASGNRLAQQATAEALGMSREQLASMIYQQEAMKIGAEGVRAKYGDQAYEALKAQNAQEKFANAVEKLKSAFSSIVQIFSPLIDGLGTAAEFVANVTSQWYILYPLVGIVALSYIPKIAAGFAGIGNSIAGAAKNFTKLFSKEGRTSLFGGGTTTGRGNNAAENLTNQASGNANTVTSTKGGGIGGFLKGIKMNDVLKGAAAILILSAALFVAAKAFQEFANVNWEEIEMAGVALLGLTGVAFMLGKLKGPIIEGAIAIAILGAALIPLGYALNVAAPGIEAFGKAIKSAFEGIGTIITAAANGISTIFTSLQSVDVVKLLLIGTALIGIGTGLAALGGGGIIGAIGSFLSGDPIKKLEQLAASGDGLQKTATALQAIAGALAGITTALSTIDVSKLETLDKFSNTQASNSAVNGITNFITAPIKAIGEVIGGGKEEINNNIDLTPMIAAINEVKAAINTLANRPINIMMDSTKVGTGLVKSSYKTP